MIKRWVTTCAVLSVFAAPAAERLLQAQPAAPAAAVPAWIPPPAPAPPMTLWRFLGIPQGFQRIGDARLNRSGNFPGLERKPPLKPIAHPDNLLSNNPAIKKAAEIKIQEDLAKQKIKAIKYLAKLGCDKCYGGVKEAMMAALDDCTERVRYEGAKALGEAAVQHCDICSRQCCCDEELTKKLAQIVYEMDDKGCPLESSERVREMAREALQACCPNVGPPLVPEVTDGGPETPPPPGPETPPPPGPETPPSLPPELPPPPGRNGVEPAAPRTLIPPPPGRNGVTPRIDDEVTPRPTLPPETSTRQFLRSRADRMAATSQVRRAPVVKRAGTPATRTPAAQRPQLVAAPKAQELIVEAPAARLVISNEVSAQPNIEAGATVTLSDNGAIPFLGNSEASENTLRIRISDIDERGGQARASDAPAVKPLALGPASSIPDSPGAGNVVRIRDSVDDLQLASAVDEPVAETKTKLPSVVSSRRSQVVVSDLFAPPVTAATHISAPAVRPAAAHEQAPAVVTPVQPAKPQSAGGKVHGHVSNIDSRSGTVRFRIKEGDAPAAGTLVKVYHQFLLGQECVGALEVVGIEKGGVATARPVGNVSLNKLSPGDHVAY